MHIFTAHPEKAAKNTRLRLLSSGVSLLRDNVRLHTNHEKNVKAGEVIQVGWEPS